tara:strand:+ start:3248 stop:4582 length:1335 start_codon:yes stop_codon:yes gene_type:complete
MFLTILLGAWSGIIFFAISFFLMFYLLLQESNDYYKASSLQVLFAATSIIPMLQFNFLAFFSADFGAVERSVMLGLKFVPLFLILYTIVVTYSYEVKAVLLSSVMLLLIGLFYPVDYFQVKLTYFINSFLPFFSMQVLMLSLLTTSSNNLSFLNDFISRFESAVMVFLKIFFWLLPLSFIFYIAGWDYFDYSNLIELKGLEPYKGVPLNWYTQFGGGFIMRFTHFFEDPILLGYLLAFISVYFFVRGKLLMSVFFCALIILTLTKGAMLWLILTTGFFTLKKFGINNRLVLMSSYILFLILMSLISFKTSLGVHIEGLVSPFVNSSQYTLIEILFGHGIGSGGNLLKAYLGGGMEHTAWLESGAESGLGTLMYQTGLLGLSTFFIIVYKILGVLKSHISVGLYLGYVFNFLLQENLINFSYISLLTLIILYIELSLQKEFSYES